MNRTVGFNASRVLAVACVAIAALVFSGSTQALVQITLDADTITQFLQTATPPKVSYQLPSGGNLDLELSDVKVTGFDPSAANGRGHILGSLQIKIPALGLAFPLEPRMSLDLEKQDGTTLCVVRFEKLSIPLALTGAVDVSSLMPVYRVPAEGAWTLPLKQGDVQVKSRLVDARMGSDGIRLGFDVDLGQPKGK
jgi:hypothetical protein